MFRIGDALSGSYCVGKVTCRIVLFGHSTVRSCGVLVERIFVLCCAGKVERCNAWVSQSHVRYCNGKAEYRLVSAETHQVTYGTGLVLFCNGSVR